MLVFSKDFHFPTSFVNHREGASCLCVPTSLVLGDAAGTAAGGGVLRCCSLWDMVYYRLFKIHF